LLIGTFVVLLVTIIVGFGAVEAFSANLQRIASLIFGSIISIFLIIKTVESALPEQFKIFIAGVLRKIPAIPTMLERKVMKNEIEGNLNTVLSDFKAESCSIAPYSAEITWISENKMSADSFFKKGKVAIVLDYSEDADRNIAEAAFLYCKQGLIPNTRQYIPAPFMRAIDLAFVDAVLERRNLASGRFYFICEILTREFNKNPNTKPYFDKLDALEEKGYFTRILLPELQDYSGMVKARSSHKEHQSQIEEFLNFISQNSEFWDNGNKVGLDHIKENIRVAIIIVGTHTKLRGEGLRPYLKRIATCGERGARNIYLVGTDLGANAIPQIIEEAINRGLGTKPMIQAYNASRKGRVEKWRIARLTVQEGAARKFLDEYPEIKDWPDLNLS